MLDPEAGLRWTKDGIDRGRALGFSWALGFSLTVDGMLQALAGDSDTAEASYAETLEIQKRLGDREGAGMSLGGLAQLASGRDDPVGALDLYRSPSPRSKQSATGARKPGSFPRSPGRTSGTKTLRSRAGTSSRPFGRTPTSQAFAGSGCR